MYAPYSGMSYDLAAGEVLFEPEGKRIEKPKQAKTNPLFETLRAVVQRLVQLVETMGGRSNQELKAATKEISDVIEKHQL